MLTELRKKLEKPAAEHAQSTILLRTYKSEQTELEDVLIDLEEAQTLVTETAREIQQQVHRRISAVVSSCLKAVFDDPYEFQIAFETKANRTEARIQFIRNGNALDPMSASGGGVVDVAAFALRIACLTLRKPALRKVLILDEPFRFLSAEYRPRVRSLIESLADEFGVQFIIVTHLDEFRCGKVITLSEI